MDPILAHTGSQGQQAESQVGSLPTEILCNIFISQRAISTTRQGRGGRTIYDLRWIQVSHVCRRWREIALEYPALWAILPPVHPEWLRLMIQRSAGVPISVDLGSWDVDLREYQPQLAEVLPQTSRLYQLALRDVGWLVMENLAFIGPRAPILKALSIDLTDHWASALPQHCLAQGAPRLQVLRLHNCSIQPTSKLLRELTELQLSFVPDQMNMTLDDVVTCLQHTPHLALLNLHWYHSRQITPPPMLEARDGHLATLPHLQHITMKGCQTFLRSLRVATACTVDITVVEADATGNMIGDLTPIVSSCWTVGEATFKAFRVKSNACFDRVTLQAWRDNDERGQPSITMRAPRFYRRTYNQTLLVQALTSTFGIDQGHSLHLECCPSMIEERFRTGTSDPLLPALHTLSVGSDADEKTLRHALQQDLAGTDQPILAFPRLRVIEFRRVLFCSSATLDLWADLLQCHAAAGAPLEHIVFQSCMCPADSTGAMERLREVVAVSGMIDYSACRVSQGSR